MQEGLGHSLFSWNAIFNSVPMRVPLVVGDVTRFSEMLRFFACLVPSLRCSWSNFYARKLCNLISAQQETETSF